MEHTAQTETKINDFRARLSTPQRAQRAHTLCSAPVCISSVARQIRHSRYLWMLIFHIDWAVAMSTTRTKKNRSLSATNFLIIQILVYEPRHKQYRANNSQNEYDILTDFVFNGLALNCIRGRYRNFTNGTEFNFSNVITETGQQIWSKSNAREIEKQKFHSIIIVDSDEGDCECYQPLIPVWWDIFPLFICLRRLLCFCFVQNLKSN